jgi:hypothetical protein
MRTASIIMAGLMMEAAHLKRQFTSTTLQGAVFQKAFIFIFASVTS